MILMISMIIIVGVGRVFRIGDRSSCCCCSNNNNKDNHNNHVEIHLDYI